MDVLVTGGAGFIGSNLTEALVDKHRVTILDDLSLGTEDNLSSVLKSVELVEGSILDEKTVSKAVRGKDIVFH